MDIATLKRTLETHGRVLLIGDDGKAKLVSRDDLAGISMDQALIAMDLLGALDRFEELAPDSRQNFTTDEISQMCLASYRQVTTWREQGIVNNKRSHTGGFLWSMVDAFTFCTVASLRRRGQGIRVLKGCADLIREAATDGSVIEPAAQVAAPA